ncbi:3'-5' exonuclease [Helicobacter muridarum]|uniref:3'-5' exonuclease n=1 Tax=Helicobacter muridarum TaxID=216 RepID=A0A099TX61_9HELI|nr:3'-5' exonuclease [Helicobacter muridarum]TLD98896.1 3'-5' exonuclease [Helicobacter muridarum]STQ87139.1 polysaccharide biosynthesis protein WlaX [Helicobacter muridarum]
MICIFDIESIPDVELLRQIYGYSGDCLDVCNQAFMDQKDKSGHSFLPLSFHRIISIASVIADDYGRFIKVGHFAANASIEDREEILLQEFSSFINKKSPRLVSFNGRGFDMPLIALRALKYNINLSGYYEVDNQNAGKNKWENYRQRYSERFHLDLFDVLGNYGATRSIDLDSVCKMAGIMGKYDIHGEQVFELIFKENNIAKVDFYCQSDVLNTYWLFLKFELTKGMIQLNHYLENLALMRDNIVGNAPYANTFIACIDKEINRYIKD